MTTTMRGPVAAAAAAALLLSGCGSDGGSGGSDAAALSVGVNAADHNSWDPSQLQGGPFALFWTTAYDTLLYRAPDGSLAPGAAEEWSYNDDNTVLTLTLRDGMAFPDGTPVDAEAAARTLEGTRDGTGPDAGFLAAVEGVDTPDERTVVLELAYPDPALPYYLANSAGVIGHPDHLGTEGIETEPAGSGPYELDASATTVGSEYTFTRSETHWNAEEYPYETVVVRTMPDDTARLNALRGGQIDTANLDPATVAEAESDGFTITTQALDWAGLMIVDREGEQVPALGDARVRQALNLAFDRDVIVESLLHGYGAPTSQIFQEDSAAYVPELEDAYDFDVDRARELMEEAGYADGFDLTMPSSPFTELYEPTIAEALGAIGVEVDYENVPPDQVIPQLLGGEYPVFWMQHESQFPWYDLNRQVAPDAIWNALGAEDDELNELLERAQYATEEDEADAAYAELGEWLIDDAWFAPVLRPDHITVTRSGIEVEAQTGFSDPFVRNYRPAE